MSADIIDDLECMVFYLENANVERFTLYKDLDHVEFEISLVLKKLRKNSRNTEARKEYQRKWYRKHRKELLKKIKTRYDKTNGAYYKDPRNKKRINARRRTPENRARERELRAQKRERLIQQAEQLKQKTLQREERRKYWRTYRTNWANYKRNMEKLFEWASNHKAEIPGFFPEY